MLRITTIHDDGIQRVLKLEGKLLAEWIGELQGAFRSAEADARRVQLELSGLSFVDAAGTEALLELIGRGVSIIATSPFVGELLKENHA